MRDAYLAGRHVLEIWPATPGGQEFATLAGQRYPLLRVGVLQAAAETPAPTDLPMFSWAQWRSERLRRRHLFELTGVGPEGGEYTCPLGAAELADDKRSFSIRVDSVLSSRMTGVQVAQMLLQVSHPEVPSFNPAWTAAIEQIAVPDLDQVTVTLRRPHLRSVALLDFPMDVVPSAELTAEWTPYRVEAADEFERRYVLNPAYVRGTVTQPREVVERQFATPRQAIGVLRRGEIDLIDRLFPADVARLQHDTQVRLVAYRLPTLHVLVPNSARPFVGNRVFRRAWPTPLIAKKFWFAICLPKTRSRGVRSLAGPFRRGSTRTIRWLTPTILGSNPAPTTLGMPGR